MTAEGSRRTGAELVVDALRRYGVSHVFGNPGTTELPLVEAIGRSDLEYVLGLHEDVAVGMAAGYSCTRRYHADDDPSINPLGVVNLHVAPGLAHGLGNLYDASISGAPMLVTSGTFALDTLHREPLLSGDLVEMTQQFTKWSARVDHVEALPTMLRRAVRVALSPPTGPVFLALPLDVMQSETERTPEPLGSIPGAGAGDPGDIERAADRIARPGEMVLVVGDQVARSGKEAIRGAVRLAEAAGARVHGEVWVCEVNFPADHDQWVSQLPPDEPAASDLVDVDTVVLAGCHSNASFTPGNRDIIPPDATCVDLSNDAWELGKNHPSEVSVLGDPALVLSRLADAVESRIEGSVRRDRLAQLREAKPRIRRRMESLFEENEAEEPPSKFQLGRALLERVPDAMVVDEGVTAKFAIQEQWPLQPEQYLSNKGSGLGFGLPASVGAALAETHRTNGRRVLGYVGDGSYFYYPQTLYAAVQRDLDLTVVVCNNRNYRVLKDNALVLMGGEEADFSFVGMDLEPPIAIAENARSYGAGAYRVETLSQLGPTLDEALEKTGPVVVDVRVTD